MKVSEEIVVKQAFKKPPEIVWKVITEQDQMVQWFFKNIPDFKPEIGFQTEFLVENQDRLFTHVWEITEVVLQKKIVYDWRYKEYKGQAIVCFELLKIKEGTQLTLTHKGLTSFPQHIPEFTRESCEQGWKYFITNMLKEYLENNYN